MTQAQIKKAKLYLDQLERTQGKNTAGEDKCYIAFKPDKIRDVNTEYRALSDIIRAGQTDKDTAYEQVWACLNWLIDEEPADLNEYHEAIDGEVSVYTSDLTEWLNKSNYNVHYLTEATEEGVKDGFQALILAQHRAYESIWQSVISLIE